MKKLLSFLVIALLPILANADESGICGDGVTYTYNELSHTLTISKTGEGSGEMNNFEKNVPWDTYKESIYEVILNDGITTIGTNAFRNYTNLAKVTIPNSVYSIGAFAFYGCSNLESFSFPESLSYISGYALLNTAWYKKQPNGVIYVANIAYKYKGTKTDLKELSIREGTISVADYAFYECTCLSSLNLPNSLKTIEEAAFSRCNKLSSVLIPNDVEAIGESAFFECNGITNLNLPNNLISIGNRAFQGCSSLISIIIPNGVTSIGLGAFNGCANLESIVVDAKNQKYDSREGCNAIIEKATNTLLFGCNTTRIPSSVTTIGQNAFNNYNNMTNINIPIGVKAIGEGAFRYCSSLTSVIIPEGVTSIHDYTFDGCSSLTEVTIPNSVTSMGSASFQNCKSLTTISIPNSVTEFGNDVFNLSGLTSINIPSSINIIYYRVFANCSNLTSVSIPDNITSIWSEAFYGCSNLSSISIGKGIKEIGNNAFSGINKMEVFYSYAKDVPETSPNAFNSSNLSNATLYVPSSLLHRYEQAEPWNRFNKILPIEGTAICKLNFDSINVQNNGNIISISGVNEGTPITVYNALGKMVGYITASTGNINITTFFQPGNIGIVKIGDKTIKISIQ